MKYACSAVALVAGLFLGFLAGRTGAGPAAVRAEGPAKKDAVTAAQIQELRNEIKKLHGLAPDQAAVMTKLAYHWTNLYFAVQNEHWELADFYLSETRANLKWAVRAKPFRKDPTGKETIDVGKIAEAMDMGPFTQIKAAVAAKDKTKTLKLYAEALGGCYACHKASYKPYLRPQLPKVPEVQVINFDPKAKEPM